MNKVRYIILPLILAGILAMTNVGDRYFMITQSLDIYASLFKELDKYYVDEIELDKLNKTAIDGMLESLDPYTNYIPEEQAESFRTITTGEYAGIGAQITSMDSGVYISLLYEGYAAHRAGLEIGDKIVKVNGHKINIQSIEKISSLLKGRPKTGTEIVTIREGTLDSLVFNVQREKITVNNVPYYGMVSKDIGYINLEDFTTGAGREVQEAVKNLISVGSKSIILDLRDNPGGLLNEAVNVSNVFIPKNKLVVETRGKLDEWNRKYRTLDNAIDDEIPLVVLVNEGSASASEIVAGVIQDYDRGILLGTQTFGKGLVQTTRPLSYNNQVKITTAKYYIPSGRCIQALNYKQRDDEGEPLNTSESLNKEYKTKSGRIVYDGAGLIPDDIIEESVYAPVVVELIKEGYIFHYANILRNKHPDKTGISDEMYKEFILWLKKTKLNYSTNIEKQLSKLVEVSKEEKYFSSLSIELGNLNNTVQINKRQDLMVFKDQIIKELEKEIALRRELAKGAIKRFIEDDPVVLAAMDKLNNQDTYKFTLTKK